MLACNGHELSRCTLGPLDVADQLVEDTDAAKRVGESERVRDLAASQLGLTRA
jgi:hypothetical protein